MKRILILLLLLALTACSFTKEKEDANYLRYNDSLLLIENSVTFVEESSFFETSLEVTSSTAGYQYYFIIDSPRNAMYNVSVIAVVDGMNYDENLMAPNFGIFGNQNVNLVPNQYYPEGGYLKGVVLNGIADSENFVLKALVSWSDEANEAVYHEYLMIPVNGAEVVPYE